MVLPLYLLTCVAVSFLFFHTTFRLAQKYFSYLPKDSCILAASYFTSLVHVLPVVAASLHESHLLFAHHQDFLTTCTQQNSDLFKYTSALLAGYMVYDFIEIARNDAIYDPLFFLHHSISFIGAFVGMTGIYEVLILPYYLGEIPVIFINLHVIAALTDQKVDLKLLQGLAGINFLLFRVAWSFILPYFLFTYCYNWPECFPHQKSFVALLVVFFTLSVLNVYWFAKHVYNAVKAMDGGKKET